MTLSSKPNPTTQHPDAEPSVSHTSRLWPGMVFALLGLNMCIVGITVYAAHYRGASFAVESDYDRKALNWNATAHQVRHNAELGWTVQLDSSAPATTTIRLCDKQGRPLEGATVDVVAFHHAQAGNRHHVTFSASGTKPGMYSAPLALDIAGLWELQFTVTRGSETFTRSTTTMVSTAGERAVP